MPQCEEFLNCIMVPKLEWQEIKRKVEMLQFARISPVDGGGIGVETVLGDGLGNSEDGGERFVIDHHSGGGGAALGLRFPDHKGDGVAVIV